MAISEMRKSFQNLKEEQRLYSCQFNSACACEKRQCGRCGWNPAVAEMRTRVILARMEECYG